MIGLCPLPWMTDETDSWWGLPARVRSIIDLRSFHDEGPNDPGGIAGKNISIQGATVQANGSVTIP